MKRRGGPAAKLRKGDNSTEAKEKAADSSEAQDHPISAARKIQKRKRTPEQKEALQQGKKNKTDRDAPAAQVQTSEDEEPLRTLYRAKRLEDLKSELRQLKLKQAGKKPDLVERLVEHHKVCLSKRLYIDTINRSNCLRQAILPMQSPIHRRVPYTAIHFQQLIITMHCRSR